MGLFFFAGGVCIASFGSSVSLWLGIASALLYIDISVGKSGGLNDRYPSFERNA